MLDGGGAECIAGDQRDLAAIRLELVRQLANGGGLARAIDAANQNHMRPMRRVDDEGLRDRCQNSGHILSQCFPRLQIGDRLVEAGFGQIAGELGGGRDAKIGGDQRLFEFHDQCRVQFAAAEDGA